VTNVVDECKLFWNHSDASAMKWKMLVDVEPQNYLITEVNEVADTDGHIEVSHSKARRWLDL
jgi:hypothetical protein